MNIALSWEERLALCAATFGSVFAGVINGLLGTGAGIVLTFIFTYICGNYSPKDSLVSAMAAVVPISLFSLFSYRELGVLNAGLLLSVALPAALGGLAGAYIGTRVKAVLLQKIFAVLVIWAGVKMII